MPWFIEMKKKNTSKALVCAVLGLLCAEAVTLSWLESLIPVSTILPPGAKLGLSNIVTMFTAASMGLESALMVAFIKSAFVGLLRGPSAFFMSVAGGMLSALCVYLLLRFKRSKFGYVGISVASAVVHNAAQLAVACIISGSNLFLSYAPVLLLLGTVSGVATGVLFKVLMPALQKQISIFLKNRSFEPFNK